MVFDASAATTSGFSLNDTHFAGPSLYLHITTIVTRFRKHKFVLTADISKMFREVSLHKDEYDFHQFVWSFV